VEAERFDMENDLRTDRIWRPCPSHKFAFIPDGLRIEHTIPGWVRIWPRTLYAARVAFPIGRAHASGAPSRSQIAAKAREAAPGHPIANVFLDRYTSARRNRTTTGRGETLLSDGDVEQNPGPQTRTEDYKLKPSWREYALLRLGCPRPTHDAFASPINAQFTSFWTVLDDAFSKDWHSPNPIWMNPPFSRMLEVFHKLRAQGGHVVLVCPDYLPVLKDLRNLSTKCMCLPEAALYLRYGTTPVPKPRWRSWILYICRRPPPGPHPGTRGKITFFLAQRQANPTSPPPPPSTSLDQLEEDTPDSPNLLSSIDTETSEPEIPSSPDVRSPRAVSKILDPDEAESTSHDNLPLLAQPSVPGPFEPIGYPFPLPGFPPRPQFTYDTADPIKNPPRRPFCRARIRLVPSTYFSIGHPIPIWDPAEDPRESRGSKRGRGDVPSCGDVEPNPGPP
jgi:hypothetical protein